jgi:hypothetical protein
MKKTFLNHYQNTIKKFGLKIDLRKNYSKKENFIKIVISKFLHPRIC